VVVGMDTGNVDTVVIAGRVMKRGGSLMGINWSALMEASSAARDRVIAKSGFKLPKI